MVHLPPKVNGVLCGVSGQVALLCSCGGFCPHDAWQNHPGRRPTASDAYCGPSDEESQRFIFEKAADSAGDENHGIAC